MKKLFTSLCIIFLLFTGCMEQPANLEQTAVPTASPTPVPTEFVPAPLEPAELTQEQWEQMKQTTTCMTPDGAVDLSTYHSPSYSLSRERYYNNPDSFRYVDYYGTYQGYTAIRIHSAQFPGNDKEEIAGCTFYYGGYSDILFCRVLLWKDDAFYHLQYAYDQGLLTEEEIKTIAYYNNLRHIEPIVSASPTPIPEGPTPVPTEFVPAPIEPTELSEDVWAQIRNSYQYVVDGELFKGATLQYHTQPYDLLYYGIYQGYIAIFIRDTSSYGFKAQDEEIDGIQIKHAGNADYWLHGRIYLWQKDVFYQLKDAYNMGLISRDDLKTIAYYHNNYKY